MSDANEPRTDYPELAECAELSGRLEIRVDADDPCNLHSLYEVTEGAHTEKKLLLLRMYDRFLYPGIDQWVLDLLVDYLCLKGYPEPVNAVDTVQVQSIQFLVDAIDGYAKTLSDEAKFPYLDILFEDFSHAVTITSFLKDRGYLSPALLRELLKETSTVSPSFSSGVL